MTQGPLLTWMKFPRLVVLVELVNISVNLTPAVGFVALHLKLVEPREDDVLDVLKAGVSLHYLEGIVDQ